MEPDPTRLPFELLPFAAALELAACRPKSDDGWICPTFAEAPMWPHAPLTWLEGVSPGVCLRFDLFHPAVSVALRLALCERFPSQVGSDGAFYEYGVETRSQRTNIQNAALALGINVASAWSEPEMHGC